MSGVQGLVCVPHGEHEVYCGISEPIEDLYEKGVALFDTRAGLRWPLSVLVDLFDSEDIIRLATQVGSLLCVTPTWCLLLVILA